MQNLAFALIALAVCAAPPPRPAGPPRHARGSGGAEAPCDAVFEVDFTRTQITGTGPERVTFREHVAIAGTVAGVLTYSEEGVEDFYLGQPSGGGLASEYDFGPEPGTRPRMAYRRDWTRVGPQQPKCEGRVIANKAGYGGFSMSMTTTGRGDLLFTHGGLQFVREGASASETDRNWNIGTEGGKSRIEAESRSSEAGVDEALSCFWAEQRAGANPGHATPDPVFQISRSALHDALASGRPAEVSGKGDYHLTLEDGVILEGTTKVTLKIRPPAIEAILEPADPGYDTWIPEGPPPGGLPRRGNQFGVRVRLVERGHPEKPVKALLHDTVFRFAEVSQQPGDCMNHPRKDPDLGPDLRFEPEANPRGTVEEEGRALRIKGSSGDDSAVLSCFDYGAYGKLVAEVVLPGQTLRARLAGDDGGLCLAVPKDDNGNHIADAWEDQKGILGENLPATWDEEDQPHWSAGKGDGLTLYEEYRGFIAETEGARRHVRLKPKVRHLFVLPLGSLKTTYVEAASLAGIVAGVDPVVVDEEGVEDDGLGSVDGDGVPVKPRWINFRAKTEDGVDFGERQYAIRIETDEETLWGTSGQTRYIVGGPQRHGPAHVARTIIFRKSAAENLAHEAGWVRDLEAGKPARAYLAARGLDPVKVGEGMLRDLDLLVKRHAGFIVLHELFHGMSVRHHADAEAQAARDSTGCDSYPSGLTEHAFFRQGDPLCPLRYWRTINPDDNDYLFPFFMGIWDPSKTAWQRPEPGPVDLPQATATLGLPAPWALCEGCRQSLDLRP